MTTNDRVNIFKFQIKSISVIKTAGRIVDFTILCLLSKSQSDQFYILFFHSIIVIGKDTDS